MKLILIFIDGIGIGANDSSINPFALSGKTYFNLFENTLFPKPLSYGGYGKGLDAGLELPGLPQSATGQTSILTGRNGAKLIGKHLSGFPNASLRRLLHEASIIKILKDHKKKVTFANAYRPMFFEGNKTKKISCTTIACQAANIQLNTIEELRNKRAICHDLTNACFPQSGYDAPGFSPQESADILVSLAEDHEVTLFEYFLTDVAGHTQSMSMAHIILFELELFLESLLKEIQTKNLDLMIISDHGNFEDLSIKTHTNHLSMFLCWGPHTVIFIEKCQTIMDPYHIILNAFGIHS